QYCWAIFQKPVSARSSPFGAWMTIEFFGRVDAPEIKTIPTNGEHACLSMIVSGLDSNIEDANSVTVEIDGNVFLPHYVGPVSDLMWNRLQSVPPSAPPKSEQTEVCSTKLTEIKLFTSARMPRGFVNVRVKNSGGQFTNSVTIEFLEPQTIIPKIHMVNNAVDGGVDIYREGDKSIFRVFADGMDETANIENVAVKVNEHRIVPVSVTFLPANGFYLIIAELPAAIARGEMEVGVHFKDLVSEPAKI